MKAISEFDVVLDSNLIPESLLKKIPSRIDVLIINLDGADFGVIELANKVYAAVVDAFYSGSIERIETTHIIGSLPLDMTPYLRKKLTCTTVKVEGIPYATILGSHTVWNGEFFYMYINFSQVALVKVDKHDHNIMNDITTVVKSLEAVKIDSTDVDYLAEIEKLWLTKSVIQLALTKVGDFPPNVRERLLQKEYVAFYMVKTVEESTKDNCLAFRLTNEVISDNYTVSSNTEGEQPNKNFVMEYDLLPTHNISAIALNWFFTAASNKNMKRITIRCRNGEIDADFRNQASFKKWPSATHMNYEKIVFFRTIDELQSYYNIHFTNILEYNTCHILNGQMVKLKQIEDLQQDQLDAFLQARFQRLGMGTSLLEQSLVLRSGISRERAPGRRRRDRRKQNSRLRDSATQARAVQDSDAQDSAAQDNAADNNDPFAAM